jgi:hypothetical protein
MYIVRFSTADTVSLTCTHEYSARVSLVGFSNVRHSLFFSACQKILLEWPLPESEVCIAKCRIELLQCPVLSSITVCQAI